MAGARIFSALMMAVQLAVAGGIIGLVATRMNSIHLGFDSQKLTPSATDTCLMGSTSNGVNLCYVAFGWAGVSILATGALSLLMCCTCNLCGLGFLLDTVFAAAGAAWWAIAGVVFNYYSQQPEIASLARPEVRHWIVILCWVGCGAFAAAFLINLYSILAKCCACCGAGEGGGKRDVESGGYSRRAPRAHSPPAPARVGSPPPGYPRPGKQGQFISGDVAYGPNVHWGAPGGRR